MIGLLLLTRNLYPSVYLTLQAWMESLFIEKRLSQKLTKNQPKLLGIAKALEKIID
jgi:hypothetical protein